MLQRQPFVAQCSLVRTVMGRTSVEHVVVVVSPVNLLKTAEAHALVMTRFAIYRTYEELPALCTVAAKDHAALPAMMSAPQECKSVLTAAT